MQNLQLGIESEKIIAEECLPRTTGIIGGHTESLWMCQIFDLDIYIVSFLDLKNNLVHDCSIGAEVSNNFVSNLVSESFRKGYDGLYLFSIDSSHCLQFNFFLFISM